MSEQMPTEPTQPTVPTQLPLVRRVPLQAIHDERGSMAVAEVGRQVPFPIARVYYLFHTSASAERGFHAHKDLNQVAVCVAGSCVMTLDDGRRREQVKLDDPCNGLLITPGMWREMTDFSPDCVLLVLASAPYDEADYIRDYDTFKNHVQASQF